MAKRKKRIPNHIYIPLLLLSELSPELSAIRLYKNNGGILRSNDINYNNIHSNRYSSRDSIQAGSSSSSSNFQSSNNNNNLLFANPPQTVLKRAPIWSNRRENQPSRRSQLAQRNDIVNSNNNNKNSNLLYPSRRRNDDVPILLNNQNNKNIINSADSSSANLQNRFNRVRNLHLVRHKIVQTEKDKNFEKNKHVFVNFLYLKKRVCYPTSKEVYGNKKQMILQLKIVL